LLRIVHDPEQVGRLRDALRGFCHRCRNSLNGMKMSLYLFRREARRAVPDRWGELEAIYQQMEQLFDHLQTIYRPMTIETVRAALDELIRQQVPRWRSWFEARGLSFRQDPRAKAISGDFDPAQLVAGLDALASWRAAVGTPGVVACIGWGACDGWIEFRWSEAPSREPTGPFERDAARRGPAGCSPPVDVLALPLLARIVAAHGGRLDREPGPGFRIVLRWPQYRRDECEGAA
jgi:signal transduction histidine kinase